MDLVNNPKLQQELYNKKALYEQEIIRYEQEEQEISQKAYLAEQKYFMIKDVSAKFGNALIFLQIGILLTSITTISKIKYFWYIGSIAGVIGFSIFIMAYYKNLTM